MKVHCPKCHKIIRFRASQGGRTVHCGECNAAVELPDVPDPDISPLTRRTYIIVAILLGWLGVHNFLAGRTGPAVAQLVLGLASLVGMYFMICFAFFTILIPIAWAIIDVFSVTRDGQGRYMI
jgi:hypothetical protein